VPLPIGRVLSGLGRGAPFCPRPQGPKASHLSHWQVFSPRLPRLTRGVALKSQTSEQTTMTLSRPMFPPRAESVDSFSLQPAIGHPESQNLTSDSPSPFEDVDLALLCFVNCLVRYGLTIDYQIHTFGSLSVVPYLMRRKSSRP
jgi:hypothetical protein